MSIRPDLMANRRSCRSGARVVTAGLLAREVVLKSAQFAFGKMMVKTITMPTSSEEGQTVGLLSLRHARTIKNLAPVKRRWQLTRENQDQRSYQMTTRPNKVLQLTGNPLRGLSAAELGR